MRRARRSTASAHAAADRDAAAGRRASDQGGDRDTQVRLSTQTFLNKRAEALAARGGRGDGRKVRPGAPRPGRLPGRPPLRAPRRRAVAPMSGSLRSSRAPDYRREESAESFPGAIGVADREPLCRHVRRVLPRTGISHSEAINRRHRGPGSNSVRRTESNAAIVKVLQSGALWVTVALQVDRKAGALRLLPPHRPGPKSLLSTLRHTSTKAPRHLGFPRSA